jgi:hypothetical protein
MKLWLVCYANRQYAKAQRALVCSAQRRGFDHIRVFNDRHLQQTDFFLQHQAILSQPRGAGYWLWKPFYIGQVLQEAAPDDVVVYSDSGIEFIADLHPLIDICKRGLGPMLFQTHGHLNITWTKRDCFVGMDCDLPAYREAQQVMGGFQIYRACEASFEFVHSWLHDCCQPQLLTDAPNECGLPNYPEFIEHRHDQSILSLLAAARRLPIYRDPSQWGTPWALPEFLPSGTLNKAAISPYENSPYGQLLNQHRRKKGPRRRRLRTFIRQLRSICSIASGTGPRPKSETVSGSAETPNVL